MICPCCAPVAKARDYTSDKVDIIQHTSFELEKRSAREFWINVESPQKGWLPFLKEDPRIFGGRWILVKEVLDEQGDGK